MRVIILILKNIAKNYNLNGPVAVSEFIANKNVSSGRKELTVNCSTSEKKSL